MSETDARIGLGTTPGECPARLAWRNPHGSADVQVTCEKDPHLPADPEHGGFWAPEPGISTWLTWQDADRRSYEGEFPGWCSAGEGCVLPEGHRGDEHPV